MYAYILIQCHRICKHMDVRVDAGMIGVYGDLDAELRERTEDVALSG